MLHMLFSLRLIALGLAPILLLPSFVLAQRPAPDALARAIDSIAAASQARSPYAGMTILVAYGDEEALVRTYGRANLEHDVPSRAQSVYYIASLTKQFTAAAILQLVEQGKIGLNDELTKFVPSFPTGGRSVTLHHLLTHTSGLRGSVHPSARLPNHSRIDFSSEEVIAQRQGSGFHSDPGAVFRYGGFAYFLLGHVVEKVSGQTLYSYLHQHVFSPLGMNSTASCDPAAILPHRAAGYVLQDGRFTNALFASLSQAGGAWGLCSSAPDLLRWQRALFDGRVISPASLQRMLTPVILNSGQQSDYAYGVAVHEFYGHRRVYHYGGGDGFNTALVRYPEDALTIAVLTNTGRTDTRSIEQSIALAALGRYRAEDQPLPLEQGQRYVGTYEAGAVQVNIAPREGGLQATISGTNLLSHFFDLELLHQGEGEFLVAADPSTRLSFVGGEPASKLLLRRGGSVIELTERD